MISDLFKLNTAMAQKGQGVLPYGVDIDNVKSIEDLIKDMEDKIKQEVEDSFRAKDNKGLLRTLEDLYGTAMDIPELSKYIGRKFDNALCQEFRNEIKKIKIRLAPPYIDTVKLIPRNDGGSKYYEIWIP